MIRLLRRLRVLFRSQATLSGMVLGIILGILLSLPYEIGLFVAVGWFLIPLHLILLAFGKGAFLHPGDGGGIAAPGWVVWVIWGILLYYIVVLFCFGLCAYQTTRRTGILEDGILSAIWGALIICISAILPAAMTTMWLQHTALSRFFLSFAESVGECAYFLLIPLSMMALLAGLVGARCGRQAFRETHASSVL